ncbi:unnamed protein product [Owenia fusiformis]|uniref:Uncharacterized protein n=1 Tax=Owenia fusiformis TaxID=6347 RepID=A0A8J1UID3_OWEFU|nr:unnamed protein product [Owenia fusiformis]
MKFTYSRIKCVTIFYFYYCTAQNIADGKCHIKELNRSGCPYGSNLSQAECEAYNCCHNNTSSPRCYKKDPICQKLGCEIDNETGHLQCPDPFKIEIARVKNIAEGTCNGVEKCETIIRKPNNTRKQCNNRTICRFTGMIDEGKKYEKCSTFINGSPTEHNTTTQEICYRCYPFPTTSQLTTTMKYTHHTRTYDNDVTTQDDEKSRKTTNKMDFQTLALITTVTTVVLLILVILVVVYIIVRRLRKRRRSRASSAVMDSLNPSTWDFSADSGHSTGASTYVHPYNEIDESQMLPITDSTYPYQYVERIPLRDLDPEATEN